MNNQNSSPSVSHLIQKLSRGRFVSVSIQKLVIYGVHFALERLIREGVDTIYWFADFQDALDPNILGELKSDLQRRKIKVFCHNFAGSFKKPEQEKAVRALAAETGGQCLVEVPR